MSNKIENLAIDPAINADLRDLNNAFSSTTQGEWRVCNHGHFVLDASDVNQNEIVQVVNKGSAFTIIEAEANLIFIAMIHNKFPALLEELDRMQWLQAELHRVQDRAKQLESVLESSIESQSQLREQIEQMRGLFDDEDGAIQDACDCHDRFNVQLLESIPA